MEVLKLVLVKMFTYEGQFFLLTHHLLQDSQIIYRLPNSYAYFFFLRVAKLNKFTYEALLTISVSWSLLYNGIGRQPHVAFWTLEFHSCCFVCSRPCTEPSSLVLQALVFVVLCQVCLVDWWMGLVLLALWSDFDTLPPYLILGPSQTSAWVVRLLILSHKRG